jgi:hypothetical protein
LVIHDGKESWTDAEAAERSGYTIIDFSDDWTPFIFAEQYGADGTVLHNRYRRVFLGLANDTLDEDGEPLPAGEKNYLELYGCRPPSAFCARAFSPTNSRPAMPASTRRSWKRSKPSPTWRRKR